MTQRILLGGLFHETHSFVSNRTGLEHFVFHEGDDLLSMEGDSSPLAGFLAVAREEEWEVVPSLYGFAIPSGPVKQEVLDYYDRRFIETVNGDNGKIDAVFLVLHGAMVSENENDVETWILSRIREHAKLKDLPLFFVHDLHANLSEATCQLCQGLVAYEKNPHTDAKAAAIIGARLLARQLQDNRRIPTCHYRLTDIILSPVGTGTADEPMRSLEAEARQIEQDFPEVWKVNINAGYAFADTPMTGVSFTLVSTGTAKQASILLDRLEQTLHLRYRKGFPSLSNLDDARRILSEAKAWPVILVEPSDNIGGGAPGDSTGLLRFFLEEHIKGSAITMWDPQSVEALWNLDEGQSTNIKLGGRGYEKDPGPVSLQVKLLRKTDGIFMLEDEHSHLAAIGGSRIDMGRSALVQAGSVTILITSIPTPPFDLGQWRSLGVQPEELKVIGIKAAVAHRQAYDPIASSMHWIDTPGPCTHNSKDLPYKNIRRPVYPLDPMPGESVS